MDWEAELMRILKILDLQVVLVTAVVAELIKRSVWHSLRWGKTYFAFVVIALAFPCTYLVALGKVSGVVYLRNAFFAGLATVLLYEKVLEPLMRKYLNGGNSIKGAA